MLRKFITDNNISFEEGKRNSSIVTLIGYSLHLNLSKEDLEKEIEKEIEEDYFLQEEIDRLWNYCDGHWYCRFWATEEAKKLYKF